MMHPAEPASSNSVSTTAGVTCPSQYGMGGSFQASDNNSVEFPALTFTSCQALGENISISGPVVAEPQPQSSRQKDESSNSGEPVSAVVDQLAAQFPKVETVDIDGSVNRPFKKLYRELDAGKSPGEAKRSMNALLLYRKAYQELSRAINGQKDHQ
ncbi:hypothetical protein Cpir12675_000993 [Ceratocystis pirilliformis]|uniref:Uncharacterized protein n=1 Tax=Ceratocystis pirilliformis TaxID=259994 RepID=A0ABR3ZIC9_9PEZI